VPTAILFITDPTWHGLVVGFQAVTAVAMKINLLDVSSSNPLLTLRRNELPQV
jgi:hypothetical protein